MTVHQLERIKSRYFVSIKKQILHFGDCKIYRARKVFCSCGLLQDLEYLDFALANIIYSKFGDDNYLQECGKKKPKEKTAEQKEALEFLEKIFGKINLRESFEGIKHEYERYKSMLKKVFPTKREFPRAYKNLDLWLKEQLSKPEN